jgi:hypothetical protein
MPAAAQDRAPSAAATAEDLIADARRQWSAIEPEVAACADAGGNDDVIVVCRETVDPDRFLVDAPTRADSRVTGSGAPRAPDFDESCLHTRGRSNCMMGGYVPPPAIMVDFDALPETPAGSDAARLYGGPTDADEIKP